MLCEDAGRLDEGQAGGCDACYRKANETAGDSPTTSGRVPLTQKFPGGGQDDPSLPEFRRRRLGFLRSGACTELP